MKKTLILALFLAPLILSAKSDLQTGERKDHQIKCSEKDCSDNKTSVSTPTKGSEGRSSIR